MTMKRFGGRTTAALMVVAFVALFSVPVVLHKRKKNSTYCKARLQSVRR